MDLTQQKSASRKRADTRSSLACLRCRSRHVKCDGGRPQCTRCTEAGKDCQYTASRRGGLDRAALAERRIRSRSRTTMAAEINVDSTRSEGLLVAITDERHHLDQLPNPVSTVPAASQDDGSYGFTTSIDAGDAVLGTSPEEPPVTHPEDIEDDALIETYYKTLHTFHPMVLPRKHLVNAYRDPGGQSKWKPLIAVLRLIGHLYDAKDWSVPLQDFLEDCLSQAPPTDPIMVQCRLLYSIALFWHDKKAKSKLEIDAAIQLAMELEMFRGEFSTTYGGRENPVLAESWRRTWWMLFIIEAYYAGTLGTMNFACIEVESTVCLPCEEHEYTSGRIPEGKTLQDFDCREFDDTVFSSFAYLIGAVRCAASAITSSPKVPNKRASTNMIQAADSMLDGWLLLLPEKEKPVMKKHGDIDELMFQAHLLIHVATVGMHRPLSDLKFNAAEDISSCARSPPPNTPTPELVNVHTTRVLRAAQAQIHLLALPSRPFSHTPFTTCMVSEGTLALLSACKFLLKDKELAVARDQIRLTIGCLRALGQTWPRTARNVQEIQTIARHALGLNSNRSINSENVASTDGPSVNTPSASDVPPLFRPTSNAGEGQLSVRSTSGESGNDAISGIDDLDHVCGWYNFGDFGLEDPSWMNGVTMDEMDRPPDLGSLDKGL